MIPPTYATCPRCERVKSPGTPCCDCPWRQNGRVIDPLAFGSERAGYSADNCGQCNTPRGGTHHYGCDVEECPHGRQATTCDLCPALEHDLYYAATTGPVQ